MTNPGIGYRFTGFDIIMENFNGSYLVLSGFLPRFAGLPAPASSSRCIPPSYSQECSLPQTTWLVSPVSLVMVFGFLRVLVAFWWFSGLQIS
jgi:hypothetical protein